jgi:hypothetical protein
MAEERGGMMLTRDEILQTIVSLATLSAVSPQWAPTVDMAAKVIQEYRAELAAYKAKLDKIRAWAKYIPMMLDRPCEYRMGHDAARSNVLSMLDESEEQ